MYTLLLLNAYNSRKKVNARRVSIIEWVVSGSQMGSIKELYLSGKDYLKETTHNHGNSVNLHQCSS